MVKPLQKPVDRHLSKQRKTKTKTGEEHKMRENSLWKISDIIGGQMLDIDPIFSFNEEYLLIPYDTAINVYATTTSLLVRRLHMSRSDRISAFAVASTDTNQLFISTCLGSIEKWDWVEGTRLEYWNIFSPIHFLATARPSSAEIANGLVYTIDNKRRGQWMLTAHRLLGGSEASKTDLGTLLKYPERLTSLKALDNGKIIVVTSGSRVIIGTCNRPNPGSLKDISYVWRDVDCPEWITSIDVRASSYDTDIKKSSNSRATVNVVIDIAVGTLKGKIIIYDDLLNNLIRLEHGTKQEKLRGVSSRRLHWHRTGVLALKWSADGNYLISGGYETVLVLWQLETGQKQVLPHLSAPIGNIVVSPLGSSYGIRLVDNSAMILSTSELQPTFNVAGIQLQASRKARIYIPFVPSVDAPLQSSETEQVQCFPTVVSPNYPGRLLFAVPSFTTSGFNPRTHHSSCYLQTFDIGSTHQISKQALTRTKDTTLNIGPEQNSLEDPNVLLMQISHDSQWLATVDEWLPPIRDVAFLAFDKEREIEEQSYRREVYLKIWSWDDQLKTWELSSRIDDPHASLVGNASDSRAVLALASNPAIASFITIGGDYTLRSWKPSLRIRDGKQVRERGGRELMNWHRSHVTALEDPKFVGKENQQGAKLAYSPDGSVLAAGYRLSSHSTIYLIDSSTGIIRHTLTGLYNGPLLGLGIVDSYLIILSNELHVWDLVEGQDTFGFNLHRNEVPSNTLFTATHLATDARHGTFAVSLPDQTKKTKFKSRVLIFDVKTASPIFETSAPNLTITLLPVAGRNGYYVIDSVAEIRVLAPSQAMPTTFEQALMETQDSSRALENIYGGGSSAKPELDSMSGIEGTMATEFPFPTSIPLDTNDDMVPFSLEKLAAIFDTGSAFTLPPVSELFEQVADLCLQRAPARS